MNDTDLIQWLRDHSSGDYRPSNRAADRLITLRNALLAIADEAVKHHEHNPISGKDRLPNGYTTILNLCCNAIGD